MQRVSRKALFNQSSDTSPVSSECGQVPSIRRIHIAGCTSHHKSQLHHKGDAEYAVKKLDGVRTKRGKNKVPENDAELQFKLLVIANCGSSCAPWARYHAQYIEVKILLETHEQRLLRVYRVMPPLPYWKNRSQNSAHAVNDDTQKKAERRYTL